MSVPVRTVVKLVRVRPGRKYWEVQVLGPSVMSGWMRSAIQVQNRDRVPPQLYVAVAFEWPGYALAYKEHTKHSEWLDEIRYRAEEQQAERIEMDEDGYWEVSIACEGCDGQGVYECCECEGSGWESQAKDEKCKCCGGDGQMICPHCDGEACWYVDYEPGLEHWPGPTAEWAEGNKEALHG